MPRYSFELASRYSHTHAGHVLDLPDCAFDVAVSNLCLHNIATPKGRERACREIVRVLKPSGMAVELTRS